tara:strand:+ start:46 stop:1419 length:1374 start_codon:yes stop_codon:yes gene_type:complete
MKTMSTSITTINPYNLKELKSYKIQSKEDVLKSLDQADKAFNTWKLVEIDDRTALLDNVAQILEDKKEVFALLMTQEMGKPISESRAEIEKCITLCDFYAENAEDFLSDELIETEAHESFISYDPLGTILAVMPWNYPFWQVFRFAIPNLTAGNTALLKHASNVTGCALAIENIFKEAGYPDNVFQTLVTQHDTIEALITQDKLKAVTLTGSEPAGKSIAKQCGELLKKTVLELGGNNACIVLDDADLETYLDDMVSARFQNTGQSCIAAKRFIVTEGIYDTFLDKFIKKVRALKIGNPEKDTTRVSVLARPDLAVSLKQKVDISIKQGANLIFGNDVLDAYFAPTILTEVTEDMPVFSEETFGPVAAIIKVKDEDEAYKLATNSRFGLGTMVFTKNINAAKKKIITIPDGAFFINSMVKSDARLPFGGTKASGYGRELSKEGMLEFLNIKTVLIKK